MAPDPTASLFGGAMGAALFGIYADTAYNCYSATNSSPQTTELFADERSETLWKYVLVGHGQALALGLFGSFLARNLWPLAGAGAVGIVMHLMYKHALEAGAGQEPPER